MQGDHGSRDGRRSRGAGGGGGGAVVRALDPLTNVARFHFSDPASLSCGLCLLLVLSLLQVMFPQVLRSVCPREFPKKHNILSSNSIWNQRATDMSNVRLFSSTLIKQGRFFFFLF